jgi:hypothetical protein
MAQQGDEDEVDAVPLLRRGRSAGTKQQKSDLSKRGPLVTKQGSMSDGRYLEACLRLLETLPAGAYSKHRINVVRKAIKLLELRREEWSEAEAQTLESLLRTLKLR